MDNNLLNDRIGRLKEWDQKELLNELLYNALSSLNAYAGERFDALTREVRDELPLHNEAPIIKIAVCSDEDIGKQVFLHSVASTPTVNSLGYITTIFAECEYPTIQELIGQTFMAEISSNIGTIQTEVALRYSSRHLQKMEWLHYAFCENEIPWATVNGIYFYKFLDVYCTQDIGQELVGFNINFDRYEKYISYDKTLLWNIAELTAPVAECEAKPAYNTIQFEHTLKNLQLDAHQYLICPFGDKFTSFQRGKLLYVRTNTKQLEQIDLLRITDGEDADSELYLPVKTNRKSNNVVDALARGRYIPTRGEAERIIHSLSVETEIRLMDIKVIENTEENIKRYKCIDFNYFIEANAFLSDKKLLLFTFTVSADSMWAYETMFYVLSELQLYFYEYRCVGEMV